VSTAANETQFYAINKIREYVDDLDDDTDDTHASVFIRLDASYEIYERKVYGLGDLMGDIGGFKESVIFIGAIFVGFF